jgi:peroxygenase
VTPLERHAAFFDPEGTGVVTLGQTYRGMRCLGVRLVWRLVLPPIIQTFLGTLTQGRLSFVIRIDKIAQGKHPFDSGVFDTGGERDGAALDALFANAGGDALTADEMRAVITSRGNRLPRMGALAGVLGRWFSGKEVALFFCVASDTTKIVRGRPVPAVTRATLERFYDGTLFPALARARRLAEAGCVAARKR